MMKKFNLKEKFNRFMEFLFPLNHTCNLCGREIFSGDYFCDECESQMVRNDKTICNHCGRRTFNNEEYCVSCSGRETYFDKARSLFVYAGALKPLIAKFKYHDKKYLAQIFAKQLSFLYYKNFFNCDLVLFVPMTEERMQERGYNQAQVLAKEFCKLTKLELCEDCLVKDKETKRQATTESVKERRLNLKGSFKVENKQKIKGKSLILIDDVMTTGATVETICEQLKKAGADKIFVLTIASVSKGPERID